MKVVADSLPILAIAPSQVIRGRGVVNNLSKYLGNYLRNYLADNLENNSSKSISALVISGAKSRACLQSALASTKDSNNLHYADPIHNCSEAILENLGAEIKKNSPSVILGVGGGKVLDAAKLIAHQQNLPVVSVPTSAATCAAWTALSNVYDDQGAFSYDVALSHCPELLIVDYDLIASAPKQTLVSGIGDAIAKWYEASVSSGSSDKTLVIAAVQTARILRDILFQKSAEAIQNPGSLAWQEVVDATVCLAGVIGGIGGAQCRTVAAHAVHNGLTHLPQTHHQLHGEKVAYGILVQLRLEEFQGNQLAATARQQLLKFYSEIGLPQSLSDLGLGNITLKELETVAAIACKSGSDLHNLPFSVHENQLIAAMVSTMVPLVSV